MPEGRIVWLDFIRVAACLMVVMVHSCDFFYYTIGEGNYLWINLIDGFMRPCVPLFVMVSSYLLLPLRDSETPGMFYRRRFVRILVPFAIWSVLYAVLPWSWGEFDGARVARELARLAYNFNDYAYHMWFMYMFVGIYLIMPVISPWLKGVSKRFEQGFLVVWFAVTFIEYVRLWQPQLLGECGWNGFGPFWYVSGYIGYVVLAHYIRMHVDWSVRRSLAVGIPMLAVGYGATLLIFDHFAATSDNWVDWELGWRFCTPNVALMAAGIFVMMKRIRVRSGRVAAVVGDMSKMSFGIYLIHLFVLRAVNDLVGPHIESIPGTMFTVGVVTFLLSYGITKALSYLPGSRYLVG